MRYLVSWFELRACTCCNNQEAEPRNPRYQVQPGNEILEPLALVETGASSQFERSKNQTLSNHCWLEFTKVNLHLDIDTSRAFR